MKNIYLLLNCFVSLNFFPQTFIKNHHPKLFILLLNPDDCASCLQGIYSLVNCIADNKTADDKLIVVLNNKRAVLQKDYTQQLMSQIKYDSVSVLWNTDLYKRLASSNHVLDKISVILVYDKSRKQFIFNKFTKSTNSIELGELFDKPN